MRRVILPTAAARCSGTHKGLIHYTIGQRRGLELSFDRPKYVIKKDSPTNTVVIGDEEELYSDTHDRRGYQPDFDGEHDPASQGDC